MEELATAYAELLQRGQTPYDDPSSAELPLPESARESPSESGVPESNDSASIASDEPSAADFGCDLTPKSILEAILFVGNSSNTPLTNRQVAALMRGVRPQEIDELVRELNATYAAEGCCYEIASLAAGYRMQLREEYASLRDQFHGRDREAKLTQPAIDVLAIVAYRQPVLREEVDHIRGKPSGGILSQLVRRGLLRIDLAAGEKKRKAFCTTDRFLQLFGLENLAELPHSQESSPEE